MAEWMRLARGLPAYLLCFHTPLRRWHGAYMRLLPYAGDWIYRADSKAARETEGENHV